MKKSLFILAVAVLALTSCGQRAQVDRDFEMIGSLLHQYYPDDPDTKQIFVNENGDTAKNVFLRETKTICKPQRGMKCISYADYAFVYDFVTEEYGIQSLSLSIEYVYTYNEMNIRTSLSGNHELGGLYGQPVPLTELQDNLPDTITLTHENNGIKYVKHQGPVEISFDGHTWTLAE